MAKIILDYIQLLVLVVHPAFGWVSCCLRLFVVDVWVRACVVVVVCSDGVYFSGQCEEQCPCA